LRTEAHSRLCLTDCDLHHRPWTLQRRIRSGEATSTYMLTSCRLPTGRFGNVLGQMIDLGRGAPIRRGDVA
jgi:hypothetical protein